MAESVLLVSVCASLNYLNVMSARFELFECSCSYLFTHRSLHFVHVFSRMKVTLPCLCHLLFNQVLCTQKMPKHTGADWWGVSLGPLHHDSSALWLTPRAHSLPSLCRGPAGEV